MYTVVVDFSSISYPYSCFIFDTEQLARDFINTLWCCSSVNSCRLIYPGNWDKRESKTEKFNVNKLTF
jgi:hypothetical protein